VAEVIYQAAAFGEDWIKERRESELEKYKEVPGHWKKRKESCMRRYIRMWRL